jgi:hypothetical protein
MLAIVAGALRLVPAWVWAIAVAALAGLAGFTYTGWQREIAAHSRTKTDAAERQAAALRDEIERHNAAMAALRGVVDDANERTRQAQAAADSARSALDAATAAGRRLRDANATNLLAAESAIAAAGASGQCAPAIEAARVRAELLDRLATVAQRTADRARRLGAYADAAATAGETCVRADEVTR